MASGTSDNNSSSDEVLCALREALKISPNNAPLRQHLAESLLRLGWPEEAEKEFRMALSLSPENQALKLGLARAFQRQAKISHAVALLDELTGQPKAPGEAFVLHARLLYSEGEVERSVRQYRRGVEIDFAAADLEFAGRLGIQVDADEDEDEDEDLFSYESEVVEGKVRESWEDPGTDPVRDIERPKISFEDVGGMESVKDEIRMKIIHPLTHPDLYKAYGKKIGGGILMYGPPGCGKTHLARATAGEIKANFISIGINDVLDMWLGNSERSLHELFEQARRNRPCVMFFDEADALGASRSDMRQSSGRNLINQFLSELDGVDTNNDGVLILAATNTPWHLDSAFRRPGRFDRIIFVPPPDASARSGILQLQARDKPVEDIDFKHLAKKTEGFSGADLKAVMDVAIEAKLKEAMKAGIPTPLRTKDLAKAAESLKPTTREWFATARNHALYSNQGGIYDDILNYLKLK